MTGGSVRARDISQSVVVTGDGNTVTLTFGDSGIVLPLRRRQFRPPDRRRRPEPGDPPRELDLLVPEAGRLPLIGRKDLLTELQTWIDDDVDISVQAVIGRAGAGKTRLALEFCLKIDSDPNAKGGWLAGFLSPSDLTPVVDKLTTRDFVWQRPTLLVIDYAAQCHEALGRWLDRLVGRQLDTKLRILLLDREAPEEFGWWRELTDSGLNTARERRDLFYAPRPSQLPDLSDLEERRALMKSALQGARALRSIASDRPQIPEAEEDPDFDRALAQPQFGNPLALVMAGVIALDHGAGAALALRHLEAARRLGRRELDRFAALAQSRRVNSNAMRHIVAFNELTDGISISELRTRVADELTASRQSVDLDLVLALLEQELPPRTGSEETAGDPRLATIQPDLIGEAAIIEAFTARASREAETQEVVRRAYYLSPWETARVLVRLVQDFGYPLEDETTTGEEKSTPRRVMSWLRSLMREIREIKDPKQTLPLASEIPMETTILREPAAELTQQLVTHVREIAERTKEQVDWNAVAGGLLNDLAIRLSALGQREEALTAAQEAVRIYRNLAATSRDAFTPDLANSLDTLANSLSDLGRREEALDAAQEAVRLTRDLAARNPDAFIPNLAFGLDNLGKMLSELGQREEALTAAQEAVRIYRNLAATSPRPVTPSLAHSLGNLAKMLCDLGRREEALTAAEEADHHYRNLAAARPDAYTDELAVSLINLAAILAALGRHEEALTAAEEAVRHHRALVAGNHDAFTPYLARSLGNLASSLNRLGRREEALGAAEEAVRLRRALAAARPDAFTPELAKSLNYLADGLSALGRREEALTAAEEAVRHCRILVAAWPDAFSSELAGSLKKVADTMRALGRPEEALAAAEEAVRHYRALAAARPDVFDVALAVSFWDLGNLYGETGKLDLAIATLAEGVRFFTPIFVAVPGDLATMVGGLVQSYLKQCKAAGREPDAAMLGHVIAEFERLNPTEGEK
jgi:tetratricopeptide (TPR) repeat protein